MTTLASSLPNAIDRPDALQRIFESLPYGVCVVDADFRVAHLNPAALPAFGDIAVGVVGRDFDEIMHVVWENDYADEIVRRFRRTLATGAPYIAPERAEWRADRQITEYYEWRVDRITLGEDFGLVCYFRDIGDDVRAREKLRDQEATSRRRAEALARLHTLAQRGARPELSREEFLAEVLDTALWMTGTTKGNIQLFDETNASLRIAVHCGLPPPFLDFFDELRSDEAAACTEALRALASVTIEDIETSPVFAGAAALEILRDAGVRAVQSTPLLSGTGQVLGILSTHYPVTWRPSELERGILDLLARQAADFLERRRTEHLARETTEQLHIVTDTMAALVTRCSRDFRYVWVSKPYCEWLERPVEEIAGRPIAEVIGAEAFEQLRPYFERVLAGETVQYEEQLDLAGLGRRWIAATYRPTYDASGQCDGWVAAVADIDERRRMEEEIEQARREAEDANYAKDGFLATVSHELRSPLQGILGWLTLLKEGSLDAADTARALEAVERSVRLQAQLVHDIMDVSRIAAGKVEVDRLPLDLSSIVRTTVDEFMPDAIVKRIAVEVLGRHGSLVLGDRERLHQVFSNLLGNALKFTGSGGRVTVSCEREEQNAVVTITDTGDGIDAEFLPKLFDPFTQHDSSSTRRHGGLGLGLAIVRHLVELHGGTVSASSAGHGCGSSFRVSLPEAPGFEVSKGEPDDMAEQQGARLDGVEILLVEDDRDVLEAMTFALRARGACVRPASSVREAWAAYIERAPDIVVSDLGMPDEDGYSLLRRIRIGGNVAVPAIALTGFTRFEDRERTLLAGFAAHMAKPVESERLVEAVRSILESHARS
jgi:PAS domain S-box-containing protein